MKRCWDSFCPEPRALYESHIQAFEEAIGAPVTHELRHFAYRFLATCRSHEGDVECVVPRGGPLCGDNKDVLFVLLTLRRIREQSVSRGRFQIDVSPTDRHPNRFLRAVVSCSYARADMLTADLRGVGLCTMGVRHSDFTGFALGSAIWDVDVVVVAESEREDSDESRRLAEFLCTEYRPTDLVEIRETHDALVCLEADPPRVFATRRIRDADPVARFPWLLCIERDVGSVRFFGEYDRIQIVLHPECDAKRRRGDNTPINFHVPIDSPVPGPCKRWRGLSEREADGSVNRSEESSLVLRDFHVWWTNQPASDAELVLAMHHGLNCAAGVAITDDDYAHLWESPSKYITHGDLAALVLHDPVALLRDYQQYRDQLIGSQRLSGAPDGLPTDNATSLPHARTVDEAAMDALYGLERFEQEVLENQTNHGVFAKSCVAQRSIRRAYRAVVPSYVRSMRAALEEQTVICVSARDLNRNAPSPMALVQLYETGPRHVPSMATVNAFFLGIQRPSGTTSELLRELGNLADVMALVLSHVFYGRTSESGSMRLPRRAEVDRLARDCYWNFYKEEKVTGDARMLGARVISFCHTEPEYRVWAVQRLFDEFRAESRERGFVRPAIVLFDPEHRDLGDVFARNAAALYLPVSSASREWGSDRKTLWRFWIQSPTNQAINAPGPTVTYAQSTFGAMPTTVLRATLELSMLSPHSLLTEELLAPPSPHPCEFAFSLCYHTRESAVVSELVSAILLTGTRWQYRQGKLLACDRDSRKSRAQYEWRQIVDRDAQIPPLEDRYANCFPLHPSPRIRSSEVMNALGQISPSKAAWRERGADDPFPPTEEDECQVARQFARAHLRDEEVSSTALYPYTTAYEGEHRSKQRRVQMESVLRNCERFGRRSRGHLF